MRASQGTRLSFTAPAMFAYQVFGFWGLYLLPLVGGLLALWCTLRLALRIFDDDRWAIGCGVALLTTPVVLNATLFNEHGVATGLVTFAVMTVAAPERVARPRHLLAAGIALGAPRGQNNPRRRPAPCESLAANCAGDQSCIRAILEPAR